MMFTGLTEISFLTLHYVEFVPVSDVISIVTTLASRSNKGITFHH